MTRHVFSTELANLEAGRRVGFVRRVAPGHVEATGPLSTVGDICEISPAHRLGLEDTDSVLAQVAAVESSHIVLIPFDQTVSVQPGSQVVLQRSRGVAPVGDEFAGRAINALAEPIDGGERIIADHTLPLAGRVLAPMQRQESDRILETGIRALDGLLTIGLGQRIGIFAASGVGKTSLIRQIASQVDCDRCVLCLVGERGREVEATWRDLSTGPHPERYVCVAATSDVSAALRARAVHQSLCLAEHWRSRGENVLLILDSVTRYAMALREIGLAAGAPPTLRAYTPNVFAALPRVVERCGSEKSGGSITAIITVLSETDDVDDPIVEVMKSLLDGHIILSRELAEQAHFPAIDVPRSVSRLASQLMTGPQVEVAQRIIARLATYENARVMVECGIYKSGGNAAIDDAVQTRDALIAFLRQVNTERTPLAETNQALAALSLGGRRHA